MFVKTASYKLKQKQYADIYRASERTVRNWMAKGAPLDDPQAMMAEFLPAQRTVGRETRYADPREITASYQRADDPSSEADAIRAELGEQLSEVDDRLMLARNFARKYQPENWEEIVEKINATMHTVNEVLTLAGIDDDYEWTELNRPDLAKPVIWNWTEDREATRQRG